LPSLKLVRFSDPVENGNNTGIGFNKPEQQRTHKTEPASAVLEQSVTDAHETNQTIQRGELSSSAVEISVPVSAYEGSQLTRTFQDPALEALIFSQQVHRFNTN
jgi:hypothetical protein